MAGRLKLHSTNSTCRTMYVLERGVVLLVLAGGGAELKFSFDKYYY
jgi:hypothetical protein